MPKLTRDILFLFLFWMVWYALTPFFSEVVQGYLILLHSLVVIGIGCVFWLRNREKSPQSKGIATIAFTLSLLLWGISDFFWSINYFISPSGVRGGLAVTITLLCSGSFLCSCFGIVYSLKIPFRRFLNKGLVTAAVFLSIVLIFTILLRPYLQLKDAVTLSPFNAGEMVAIVSSFILLNFSFLVILSSKSAGWAVYGAGLMSLVLGDSSIRSIKISEQTIDFDIYSVLCSFGIYASAIGLFSAAKEELDEVDFSSLFTTYKNGSIFIFFCVLVLISLFQGSNVNSVRLMVLCGCFASFLSIFLSDFLIQKITLFSTRVGMIVNVAATENIEKVRSNFSDLPSELRDQYSLVFERSVEAQRVRALNQELEKIAMAQRQVAHDIRSPLVALNMIKKEFAMLPESSRVVLRSSVNRISDVVSVLSSKGGQKKSSIKNVLLSGLIDEVVAEKRIEYKTKIRKAIEFNPGIESYGLFAKVDPLEFKRALSNIINNAMEAIQSEGLVQLSLKSNGDNVHIQIADNGIGMSSEQISRLGKSEFTTKQSGQGLGIYHAMATVEELGGRIQFSSIPGKGTTVLIEVTRFLQPEWFVPFISISNNWRIVVVDDDFSIHHVWEERFKGWPIFLEHCYTEQDFEKYLDGCRNEKTLFLVDFELLGSEKNGLELIEQLGIREQVFLVTSHFENDSITRRCNELKVKVIPKNMATLVPIQRLPAELQEVFDHGT